MIASTSASDSPDLGWSAGGGDSLLEFTTGLPARSRRRDSISEIQLRCGPGPFPARATFDGEVAGFLLDGGAAERPEPVSEFVSKATRLMFNRCSGDTLSLIIDPPTVPGPSVNEGKRRLVYPTDPSAATELTTIRMAGF